jgi:hypothetical protein
MNITKEAADIMNKALVASWQIANGRTFLYFSENEDTLRGLKHVIRLHFAYTHTTCYQHVLRKGRLHGNQTGFFLQVDCTNQ